MGAQQDGKDIQISLHSSIQHPGQKKDTVKLTVDGVHRVKNGTSYIQYAETEDGQSIQSTIKLGQDEALIMRSGAVQMRLPFSRHENRRGQYRNPHMNLPILVKTKKLAFQEDEQQGAFSVRYELHANGALLGTYELSITYMEGK